MQGAAGCRVPALGVAGPDLSGVEAVLAEERIDERRLAGAGLAQERHRPTMAGQCRHCGQAVVATVSEPHGQHRHSRCHGPYDRRQLVG